MQRAPGRSLLALAAGAVFTATVSACASIRGPGQVRYVNRDPIWQVSDRKLVPRPEENEYHATAANVEGFLQRPIMHGLGVPEHPRAKNVNSLGEVPDSTWFTNRIGVRDISPAEVARGPNERGPPRKPWTITRTKTAGAAPGLFIEDARGFRYILKFDPKKSPETETAADVIVQRLLWAVGYHVPEDYVVHFDRTALVLADDAVRKEKTGEEEPLREAHIDELLSKVAKAADGQRWRGLASSFLEGVPIGGYPMRGVRADDPNDRVPHQHRRDVRGQHTFFAWLAHTDMKVDNSLDMWIETRPSENLGYVKHYLLDFGKALGVKGRGGTSPHDGWQHKVDYGYMAASLFSFGLWRRPWEGIPASDLRGVGRYEAARYEPEMFHTTRSYTPYFYTDRFDAYWASKIMMRLDRDHIAKAVEQGQYSDPRARDYMTRTIVARKRKTARHWFRQVNPVDYFRVQRGGDDGWRVCGTDLMIAHDLADVASTTRYRLRAYDYRGRPLDWQRNVPASDDGTVCVSGLKPRPRHEGYTILTYRTLRGPQALPVNAVHLARDPKTGRLRVIGIRRR